MSTYKQILTKYWGHTKFRPLQEEIITAFADEGKDVLGLFPTGGGKSVIFQVPALAKEGLCLVITPLIALMKDQVENLISKGIKAAAVYSGMSKDEIDIVLNNAVFGAYKFLYLSPERLATQLFLTRFPDMNINFIAVDEAHCISQWGYDFRPSYLNIANIRKIKPDVPFIALTATATPEVATDIQDKLLFKKHNLFQKSFERKNLIYIVREVEDKLKYLLKIVVKETGTGIVYVRSRKKTVEISKYLHSKGINADYYHAGIDAKIKDIKQKHWKTGQIRVIVATNAFGMGIDKHNVRFVVHVDLPDSPEAYFQEAGRAGRDEKTAYAVLLYHKADKLNIEKRIQSNFPEISEIKHIYSALCNYYQIPETSGKGMIKAFSIRDFVSKFKLPIQLVLSSLKILQSEGYLDFTEDDFTPSKVLFTVDREDLYRYQVANKNFDSFIKLILRSYTGLFSNFTSIDEEYLAKKAHSKSEIIYGYLEKLAEHQIIKYIPQRKMPFIIFTSERLNEKNLLISKENYRKRKERYVKRAEAMLHYAESKAKCRSQILLSYFGEKNAYRCGECDVCRRRNKLNISNYEFDLINNKIKKILKEIPVNVEKLIDAIDCEEEKTLKVIQWLLESEKIEYTIDQRITWKK
ncbi:MAG: RecQ family ATP-dependent DNA helicase [Chlorobi bacterium]|nr:RecQ family ATP-dependent DNA helicase [Chlorobiota bacterium]